MNTYDTGRATRRRRRTHSAQFKAQVVAACRRPGVSIAAVALEYRLNANLVRRWVVTAERAGEPGSFEPALAQAEALPTRTAFVPVEVQSAAREIVIELRRGATTVKLTWPVTAAEACGAWLRELLR